MQGTRSIGRCESGTPTEYLPSEATGAMRKNFLVGNFLRAYSGSFRYTPEYGADISSPDPEWLGSRFQRRAEKARARRYRYALTLQLATIAAIAVPLVATQIDYRGGSSMMIAEAQQEVVTLQEIAQTVQRTLPPPPPRPPVPVEVPNETILEDDMLDLDATLDIAVAAELPPPPALAEEAEEEEEPEIFVVVEEMPEMIGGAAQLAASVEYPHIARKAGLEGLVVVKIVVNPDGTPSDPTVLKSPGKALDTAAIDAVMKQRFKPGRQRGRAVAAYMAIPVRFQLTSS